MALASRVTAKCNNLKGSRIFPWIARINLLSSALRWEFARTQRLTGCSGRTRTILGCRDEQTHTGTQMLTKHCKRSGDQQPGSIGRTNALSACRPTRHKKIRPRLARKSECNATASALWSISAPRDYVAQPSSAPQQKTAPQSGAVIAIWSPVERGGAGNEIRTHDFNLGNIRLAPNTIREIQQYQPQRVPWRCVPSRGVPWKVEGWVEDLRWRHALLKPAVELIQDEQVESPRSHLEPHMPIRRHPPRPTV
jgi:hypothetical protein